MFSDGQVVVPIGKVLLLAVQRNPAVRLSYYAY